MNEERCSVCGELRPVYRISLGEPVCEPCADWLDELREDARDSFDEERDLDG